MVSPSDTPTTRPSMVQVPASEAPHRRNVAAARARVANQGRPTSRGMGTTTSLSGKARSAP